MPAPPNTLIFFFLSPSIFKDKSGLNFMRYDLACHEITHAAQVKALLDLCWIGTQSRELSSGPIYEGSSQNPTQGLAVLRSSYRLSLQRAPSCSCHGTALPTQRPILHCWSQHCAAPPMAGRLSIHHWGK